MWGYRNFTALVRLLKHWRNFHELDDSLRSFTIELIVSHLQDAEERAEFLAPLELWKEVFGRSFVTTFTNSLSSAPGRRESEKPAEDYRENDEGNNRGALHQFVHPASQVLDGSRPKVEIKEMGDSGAILTNKAHLRETAREMIRRGLYPQDGGWNGWLGRYQKARLTPHSHSNRRRRKNANGAEAET